MTKQKKWLLSCIAIAAFLGVVFLLEQTIPKSSNCSMLFTVLEKGSIYALVAVSMNLVNGYNNVGWCVVSRTATTVKIGAWNNNSYDVTVNVGVIGVDSRYGTVV